jgi:hypothetical protein
MIALNGFSGRRSASVEVAQTRSAINEIVSTANTRRMAGPVAVPGTRVVELQAGHQTYADAPLDCERAVLGFLDEVVTAGSSAIV